MMRQNYRRVHIVEFGNLVCMDGRVSIPLACGMPMGSCQTWNTAGAMVDLASPVFYNSLLDWYECVTAAGRICIFGVTSHYSQSNVHMGCRAHDYNRHAAEGMAVSQARQLMDDFALYDGSRKLYPVVWIVETDRQAITLRKLRGSATLAAISLIDRSRDEIVKEVVEFYRGEIDDVRVSEAIGKEIMVGNIGQVKRNGIAGIDSAGAIDHAERALCWGRGFDWVTESARNTALIIGHFDPDAEAHIRTAADILYANLVIRKTVPLREGVALITSVPYRAAASEPARRFAERKAEFFHHRAMEAIARGCPELLPHLHYMVGVVNNDTRRFRTIRRGSMC